MDSTALLLSRLQVAFTISFHIIFPAFTIEGLFVFPLMLLYTAFGYRVVRGKVESMSGHY